MSDFNSSQPNHDAQQFLHLLPFYVTRKVSEDEAATQLLKAVDSRRLIPMPTQNLTELIAALSLCDLFIGTDGGAMHLAVALNKKILALFESLPGKLNHWYPWQVDQSVVCSADSGCPNIDSISQAQVTTALASLGF